MNKNEALLALRVAANTLSFAQSSVLQTPQLPANDIFVDVDPNRVSVLSSGVVVCQPQVFGSPLRLPDLAWIVEPMKPVYKPPPCTRCGGTGDEPRP